MPPSRFLSLVLTCTFASTQYVASAASLRDESAPVALDSDRDGLSDAVEQALLLRFAPSFQTDPHDCAGAPATFLPDRADPVAASEDGTIYGQATPRILTGAAEPLVELRYFHLWKSDCGRYGHALDTEHVSVLIQKNSSSDEPDAWRALYWYAAAHQDTVCDASQITRASTLHAEDAGPRVWISRGKHASFLNQELCHHGCGGDACQDTQPFSVARIVNLGEEASPMNGAQWAASSQWPLAIKLTHSDFDPAALARLQRLPDSDIAWVNPSKRPAQGTIAVANTTADALAMSNRKTDTAISLAGGATGNALDTTYDKVGHSLKRTLHGVGNFLRGRSPKSPAENTPQHPD